MAVARRMQPRDRSGDAARLGRAVSPLTFPQSPAAGGGDGGGGGGGSGGGGAAAPGAASAAAMAARVSVPVASGVDSDALPAAAATTPSGSATALSHPDSPGLGGGVEASGSHTVSSGGGSGGGGGGGSSDLAGSLSDVPDEYLA